MDLRCKNKYRSKNFLAITDAFSMYNNAFKSMVSSSLAICSRTCTCTVYTEPYECFKTTSSGSSERLVVWRGNKIWRCFWPPNLAASAFDKTRINFKLKRQHRWIYIYCVEAVKTWWSVSCNNYCMCRSRLFCFRDLVIAMMSPAPTPVT